MKPEQWEKIEQLYHAALERAPAERAAFLAGACVGDLTLRQEVESLLAYDEPAQRFITTPPATIAAELLAAGQAPALIGSRLKHYQILARLGKGGMGEVFLAVDTELGRKVALKLLPAHCMSDPERVRRFKQEARAASALNHPNIVTIHEIGQVDATHYIVTEFIEGQTLRQQMSEGKLGMGAALEVAAQVASALAAAHAAGVVHRDIKPENVMLRPDGLVKVLDFGLAKLTEPSRDTLETAAPTDQNLTKPGEVMGTPHYMSPEQARGLEIDARSDIFSLGVVLYELIAGRPPFVGATTTDVIISIVQQEPEPLARCAPAVPHELEQIVAKALGKEPPERYQKATELLAALKGLKQRLEHETKLERSGDVAVRRSWSWRKVAIAALVVVLLLSAWLWLAQRKPEAAPVIAVLPFKNLSTEPESEYFVDGLTDEIIRNLALIEGMEVRSRTSSFAFKNKQPNIREVGEQLKANWVLEGSVLRAGGKLRINTSFVRVADEFMLWNGAFEKEQKDILFIQDEISRSIVNGLRLKLGRGKRRYDTNPESYEMYLKACSLLGAWAIRTPDANKSAELFEQVIAKDPAFAPAYAGLADACAALSSPVGTPLGQLERETAFARIRPAAERALQLDPLLAEAHAAMGRVYSREMDWASAEKAYRRATELNPNLTAAYLNLAIQVLCPTGRIKEALQELDKATRADPLSADPWDFRATVLINAGRYDEAIESCHRSLALAPKNSGLIKVQEGRALVQKGRTAEAIAILEQLGVGASGQLGYAYAITGRRAEAEALAAKSAHVPNRLAFIYAGLGDKDRVFEALEGMVANRDPRAQVYLGYPELALIRGDPRLAAFRKKVGLQ